MEKSVTSGGGGGGGGGGEGGKKTQFDLFNFIDYHRVKELVRRRLQIEKVSVTVNSEEGEEEEEEEEEDGWCPSPTSSEPDEDSSVLDEIEEQLKVDYQREYGGPTNFDDPRIQNVLKVMRLVFLHVESLGTEEEEARFWEEMVEEELKHPDMMIFEPQAVAKIAKKVRWVDTRGQPRWYPSDDDDSLEPTTGEPTTLVVSDPGPVVVEESIICEELEKEIPTSNVVAEPGRSWAPLQYMNLWDTTIDAFSNHIKEKSILLMHIDDFLNPHQICGSKEISVDLRKDFQMQLQFDSNVKSALSKDPDPASIKPGMYMLARLLWGDQTKALWYRVRVMQQILPITEEGYKVYGLDYGFQVDVPLEDLRYMPKAPEITEEMAYAVPMKLEVEHPAGKGVNEWDDQSFRTLAKLIGDTSWNMLDVQFLSSKYSSTYGCLRWTVRCRVVECWPLQTIVPCLGTAFKREYKTIWDSAIGAATYSDESILAMRYAKEAREMARKEDEEEDTRDRIGGRF